MVAWHYMAGDWGNLLWKGLYLGINYFFRLPLFLKFELFFINLGQLDIHIFLSWLLNSHMYTKLRGLTQFFYRF
jgi:hypothetical protein